MKSFITKAVAFTAAACLSTGAQAATFESKDGVLLLNDQNWAQEMEKHSFMLTMFYAPWCGHCNLIQPEYIAAAQELAKDNRPLAVINGDNDDAKQLMKDLNIDKFPTFIWFKHQNKHPFNSDNDRESIVKFVKEQSGLAASSSVKSTEISECSQVQATIKADKFASILFSGETTKLFNFYQQMITEIDERHSDDRKDNDFTIFHYAEASEDDPKIDIRLPKFKYYHAKPECITEFKLETKDGGLDMKYNEGRIVVISPDNKPEVIQDEKGLGLDPYQLSRFLVRFTEPAFRKVDRFTHPEFLQPNFFTKENRQCTFLISREPKKSVKAFAAMDKAAIKMKFVMKYGYIGNIKPTKKEINDVKEVTEKQAAHRKVQLAERDVVDKKRKSTGSMTQARKDLDKEVDNELKALIARQKEEGFSGVQPTPEQKDIMENIEEEKLFQNLLDHLSISESELPLIMNFDPIAANHIPMYIKSSLKMDEITVDQLVKMAERFNGHWDKPYAKSEVEPKDNSKPHKTIVATNYAKYTGGDNEALVNHNVDWETFCKILQPEWIKLAEALKDVKGLNIGTFNTEKNQVGFVNHKTFPSIVHYTKTNKRGRKIKFNNRKGKQVESFVNYLTKHSDAFKAHLAANPTFDAVAIAKDIKVEMPKTEEKTEEKKEEKKEEKVAEPAAPQKDAESEVVDLDAAPEAKKEEKKEVKTDL